MRRLEGGVAEQAEPPLLLVGATEEPARPTHTRGGFSAVRWPLRQRDARGPALRSLTALATASTTTACTFSTVENVPSVIEHEGGEAASPAVTVARVLHVQREQTLRLRGPQRLWNLRLRILLLPHPTTG